MTDSESDQAIAEVSPGEILRLARERAGLSLREVADKLHFLPRQIEALEKNEYQHFGGDIFCRGYIKAYANLLGVDPAPLLVAYQDLKPASADSQPFSTKMVSHIQHPHKGKNIHYWSIAATIIVAVVLWFYGSRQEAVVNSGLLEVSTKVEVDKNALISTAIVNDASGRLDNIERMPVNIQLLELKTSDRTAGFISANETMDSMAFLPEGTISVFESVDSEHGTDIFDTVSEKESWLIFKFKDDCWVEVKDRDDNVVFANLKRANDSLRLKGKAPFKVLLGYAHGVSVNYNGEPVTFRVNQKNNAARMVIGQL